MNVELSRCWHCTPGEVGVLLVNDGMHIRTSGDPCNAEALLPALVTSTVLTMRPRRVTV